MKKSLIAMLALAALAFGAVPASAECYVTLANVNMRKGPDSSAAKIAMSKRGWLLKGSPSDTAGWIAVSEVQENSGEGFSYVYRRFPQAAGEAYMSAEFLMPVPHQEEGVFPAEDAYTPAFDAEGCVCVGTAGKALPFGPNETQDLWRYDFAKVFRTEPARAATGESISFASLKKTKKNPWRYIVEARVQKDGREHLLKGTLTLVKAGAFDNGSAALKNVATGKMVERVNGEVRNGFVSGDLVLSNGTVGVKGIITAYFCYRFDWEKQSLGVEYFHWPKEFIKGFQNPYFITGRL